MRSYIMKKAAQKHKIQARKTQSLTIYILGYNVYNLSVPISSVYTPFSCPNVIFSKLFICFVQKVQPALREVLGDIDVFTFQVFLLCINRVSNVCIPKPGDDWSWLPITTRGPIPMGSLDILL